VTDRLRIGRFLGIPIDLHWSWPIVLGLIVWTLSTAHFPSRDPGLSTWAHWAQGIATALLFFLSLLLHELGHAAVAQHYGLRTRSITLFLFGGVAQLEKDAKDGRLEMKMAAAGPVVSLALAGAFLLCSILPIGSASATVAHDIALMNLTLAAFNLLPAFPMDGGRILRGILWGAVGKMWATRIAGLAGTAFAYMLIVLGIAHVLQGSTAGVWYVLIGWFVKDAATTSYQQVRLEEALRGVTVRDAMLENVATVPAEVSIAEAAREHFLRTGYGAYPVMRGEAVVGLVCLKDVLRLSAEERDANSVQAVMRPLAADLVTDPAASLLDAMVKMARAGAGRLLVMHGGRLVGLLTMNAVLRQVRVREQLGL
jgi:Zn-dependent protease/CBS domain-containing protein